MKASCLHTTSVTDSKRAEWEKTSFMNNNEMKKLDNRLHQYRDRNKTFREYSIIFGGDFRKLAQGHDGELLYLRNSTQFFEDTT